MIDCPQCGIQQQSTSGGCIKCGFHFSETEISPGITIEQERPMTVKPSAAIVPRCIYDTPQ